MTEAQKAVRAAVYAACSAEGHEAAWVDRLCVAGWTAGRIVALIEIMRARHDALAEFTDRRLEDLAGWLAEREDDFSRWLSKLFDHLLAEKSRLASEEAEEEEEETSEIPAPK